MSNARKPVVCSAVALKRRTLDRCPFGATAKRAAIFIAILTAAARADLPTHATIDQTLDALHDRGTTLRSFTADLKLTEIADTFMTSTLRSGTITFDQTGQSPRMRVLFETKKVEKKPEFKELKGYELDGNTLIDRDYHAKNEVLRQVAKPGEKINLFQLGKGPFPLPIGQDRKSVTDAFDLKLLAAAPDDPADTVHLQLTPKTGTPLERKFSDVQIWVDRKNTMPVRIQTTDANGTTDRITDLQHMRVNPEPAPTQADFELPPKDATWTSSTEAMN